MGDVALAHPVNAVLSYAYYGTEDIAAMASAPLRIVADSGAFSMLTQGKHVDPDAYYAWLADNAAHFVWAAALDVIGDDAATWTNWRNGPHHLVPTVHYGAPPATLDRYADAGATLVGLGGMVARRGEHDRLLRWATGMFRHARNHHPHLRFHGWGVSHPRLLASLPWWSTDTSGIGSGYRYGRLKVWDDRTRTYRAVTMDGRGSATDRDLVREYGLDWQDITHSTPATRRHLMRLGVASLQRQERWLQQRHHVTPPTGHPRLPPTGPILHAVDGSVIHWTHVRKDTP